MYGWLRLGEEMGVGVAETGGKDGCRDGCETGGSDACRDG